MARRSNRLQEKAGGSVAADTRGSTAKKNGAAKASAKKPPPKATKKVTKASTKRPSLLEKAIISSQATETPVPIKITQTQVPSKTSLPGRPKTVAKKTVVKNPYVNKNSIGLTQLADFDELSQPLGHCPPFMLPTPETSSDEEESDDEDQNPSTVFETFPAIQASVPVPSTTLPPSKESLQQGESGFRILPDNPRGLQCPIGGETVRNLLPKVAPDISSIEQQGAIDFLHFQPPKVSTKFTFQGILRSFRNNPLVFGPTGNRLAGKEIATVQFNTEGYEKRKGVLEQHFLTCLANHPQAKPLAELVEDPMCPSIKKPRIYLICTAPRNEHKREVLNYALLIFSMQLYKTEYRGMDLSNDPVLFA